MSKKTIYVGHRGTKLGLGVENTKEAYDAYELLTTGKSICGGYSDIMAIYLNKLNIQNYKGFYLENNGYLLLFRILLIHHIIDQQESYYGQELMLAY